LLALPSSHCSPAPVMLSPHVATVQKFVQLSVLTVLASSHCSPRSGETIPSPQAANWHVAVQVSEGPPVSHCSLTPIMPSPQIETGVVHIALTHAEPGAQTLLHAPQCCTLVMTSTHAPGAHSVRPAPHAGAAWHTEFTHAPPPHDTPQAPQLFGSLVVLLIRMSPRATLVSLGPNVITPAWSCVA